MTDSNPNNARKLTVDEHLQELKPRLKAILGRYRIPPQDAEDLLQDALLLLIRKVPTLRDPKAYLLTTLKYRCQMYWRNRGRQRQEAVHSDHLEAVAKPQAPSQEAAVLRHDLGRVLADLPPRPRRLIRLRYGLGYTAREVAEHMGVKTDAIRQRSTHARNLFARHLSRHEFY
jgi:RNA polymerase sigma factor (sigma-70 family)